MRRLAALAVLALAAAFPARAARIITTIDRASTTTATNINLGNLGVLLVPEWKCVHASGAACTSAELANSYYRQVLILPSGFGQADQATFFAEFDKTVATMSDPAKAGSSWTVQKKNQLLYIGWLVAG